MKHNEFMHLEETCPKCNNTLMFEKRNWIDISGSLYYVFCEPCHCKGNGANDKETALKNFHKQLARKEKLALRKPEKILTDIRDYLNGLLAEWNGAEVHFEKISLVEKQLANLIEYAEKLGVEL